MVKKKVKFEWAYDKDLILRNVNDFSKDEQKELEPFICRLCYEENNERKVLIPKKGKKENRAHHFAIKNDKNHKHSHTPESIAHSNEKDNVYRLLNDQLRKKEPFYIGIEFNPDSNSQKDERRIQRIDILKSITEIKCEKVLENGRRPDISLLNKEGSIRAIEIVVSHHPDNIQDLTEDGIELIILKLEPSDFKSKLNDENELKFMIRSSEIHNPSILICIEEHGDGKFCIDDEEKRLLCFVRNDTNGKILDFEKCQIYSKQEFPRCKRILPSDKKCNRVLLEYEKDFCYICSQTIKEINNLNSEAQTFFDEKNWEAAIEKWMLVQILELNNKIAEEGIEKAKEEIKKEEADRITRQIQNLNQDAQRLFHDGKWENAKVKWEGVLELDQDNEIAKAGIEKAKEEIIKEDVERKKRQIQNLNQDAKRLFDGGKWEHAKIKWEGVLALDPDNEIAKERIKKAKEEIKKEEVERKKRQIQNLNQDAQRLFDDGKWEDAIIKWEKVLALDPDNEIAKEGIEKAEEEIKKANVRKEMLFCWDEIPGNDNKKLIDFLKHNLCVNWIKPELIKKTEDGKTIKANWGKDSFTLTIVDEISKAILTINDIFTDRFIVKTENGKINIYEEILEIKDLDLPTSVKEFYKNSGILSLYSPQKYAINARLLEGKNIVAAIPTASGKTLLAEFAMLKSILNENKKGKALYIVPLRALASEKYERFRSFEAIKKSDGRGVSAGIATGDLDARDDWLGQFDIIVATSEKVDSLLRNGSRWIDEVTVVIADEVHLIDSPDRGPTLEIVLAKLMKQKPQIIALSATIGNAKDVAKWLSAEPVVSDWRPIVLKEGVFFGNDITFGDNSHREVKAFNKDSTISLAADTLKEGGQCIIFESSRKNTEGQASRTGIAISKLINGEIREKLKILAAQVIETSEVETTKKLAQCIENGSAFHHAGLISEQRKIVENGFRDGTIKVIAATPTLAAGLNLPARRVIIKGYRRYDVNKGQVPIPVLEYKQMAGRAGRPRLDPYGESVLVAKNYEEIEDLRNQYVLAGAEKIWSKLGIENALRTHILSIIVTGFAKTMDELLGFMKNTFYSTQQEPWSLKVVIDKIISFLVEKKMIEQDGLNHKPLGDLVSRLYIDPLSASTIIEGLEKIEEKGIQYTELTLLHLVSMTTNMRPLYLRSNDYLWLSDFVMEHHTEFITIPPQSSSVNYEWFLSQVKTACVMLDWINEKKEEDIVNKFGIGEGDIRALSETTLWLVHSMAELAVFKKLPSATKTRELEKRVEYGASPELLDLIQIRGIGRVRSRKLYNAGIRDMEALRAADPGKIAKIIGTKVAIKVLKQIGSTPPPEEKLDEQRRLEDFG